MADNTPGITVLIATFNRAAVLRETLQALTRVDRTGIDCSIVIIDNNSSDNTAEVVKEYGTRLPLSYLREQRPGKSCALNRALRECALKEIVVFTDDDVTPAQNWLQEIASSVKKRPGIAAFGGKIELMWPDNKQPEWAVRDWLVGFAFPRHHYADVEAFYKPRDHPLGPNFWVRKIVFQKVPFFDETIGARATNEIVGEEATFLMSLQERGFQILYYPQAVIYHRNLPEAFTLQWLKHRAYTWGRGRVRLYGWHRRDLYRKNKILWCIVLIAEEFYNVLRLFAGIVLRDPTRNCERAVSAMIGFGELHETANQVFKHFKLKRREKLNRRDRLRHRPIPLSKELADARMKRLIKSLIPKRVRAWRSGTIDYRRLSYAQEGEDLILAALFDLEFSQTPGFYVDVGAHHPKLLSNTFVFYMNGWSGINIDAMPGSMLAFQHERPRDINIEAAVGEGNKALTFYEFNQPALSSFCRDRVPMGYFGWTIARERQLTTTTLAHLLGRYLPPGELIDFMSVDVEGFDLQVLRSNDWARFRPAVVLVEDDEAIQSNRFWDSSITSYMLQQGYDYCCKTLLTTFFVDQRQVERTLRGIRVRPRPR